MSKLKTLLSGLAVALLLVVAADYASMAATGQSLILGRKSTAGHLTTLERTTTGPALKVQTRSNANPPLAVNGRGRVTNLNADRVDGKHASQLLTRTLLYEEKLNRASASSMEVAFPDVPAGRYLVDLSGFVYATQTGGVACSLRVPSTQRQLWSWFDNTTTASWFMLNLNGVVRVPATQDLILTCYTNDNAMTTWTSLTVAPLQAAFTRIDVLTTGVTAAPRTTVQPRVAAPTE